MSVELDALLGEIEADSDDIAAGIVAIIRTGVGTYSEFPVPPDMQLSDVRHTIKGIIAGVRYHRLPSPDAIAHARTMGRTRAKYGLPLHEAIAGYHIGYREIWNRMLDGARHHKPDLTVEVAQEVSLLWDWFQRLSSAFADDYVEESQSMLTSQLAATQRLVRGLIDDSFPRAQRDELLSALGFDPSGEFIVSCAALRDDPDIVKLNEVLAKSHGTAHSASSPTDNTVIVTQGLRTDEIMAAVQEVFGGAAMAIGLRRSGSDGAALSLADALEGIAHAHDTGQIIDYENDWLFSIVTANIDRLGELFTPGLVALKAHPNFAETVVTYLQCRQSTTACARALFLHPNSIKYRLQRWTEMTGWDLHTVDGLVRSTIALRLASNVAPPQDRGIASQ